ncbi:tape measure protein [Microbacterium azadirachtae]|uniref:tape measure protein n=1 Tax=Microbacterium azadirachtae TaxID=582680 RepID=UPI0021D501AA|nr:tape measure protein [Microbacterium azadirachtae]UXW85099.1 tape measure protein [Microbacterium azadirachtae]
MALDLGTLVAKVRVDDDDFDKKTSGWSTRGAAVASAFGNVAADAISQAAGMLQGWVSEAVEASDATDKFKQSLSFAGIDNSTIDKLTKSTKTYADETIYSLTDVMGITSQLAANGVKDYDTLAMSLGNLNAASSGNAETYSRLGSVLTQTAGAGKLTTENWNQLSEAIPGASGLLMDALLQAGAYTGNFREAMEKGEISADEFNAAITQLGQNQGAVDAAKNTETFEGSIGSFQAGVVSLITQVLNELKPAFVNVMGVLSGFVGWISENASWLGPLALGIGIVATAVGIWSAAQWVLNAAMTANPIGLIIVGIGLLIGAIILLVQNWDTVVAWITEVWSGFIGWITGVIEGFVGWWNGIWAAVGQWISDVWSGFTSWVKSVWEGFVNFLVAVLVGYISFWIGAWNTISQAVSDVWNAIVSWVSSVVSGFVGWLSSVWNGFTSFWSGLWSGVQSTVENIWNGIVGFFEGIPDTILGFFQGAGEWLMDVGANIIQGLIDGINSMVGAVGDAIGGVLDWAAGFFPHSPAKRGPLSGAGWYAIGQAGEAIVAAFAAGLEDDAAIQRELEQMLAVPSGVGFNSGGFGYGSGNTKVVNNTVNMTEVEGETSEEALFRALGSPRIVH